MSGDSNFKFTYFDARARGELCRLILTAAGQPFAETRLTFEEWPAVKPSKYTNSLISQEHLRILWFVF